MHDAVTDWQQLSALYEQADALSGDLLQAWLATLREQSHPLLEPLLQMLSARAEVQGNGFLDALPNLPFETDARAADWHAGARIGPYRLQRPLGAGGMAEVWRAARDDGAFQRTVAIKLLFRYAGGPERDSFAQRFARERDILASLHHPNIAALHDAGVTPAGQPWLALEYVEGEPLTEWCDRARLGVRGRVELFIQVLLAVQHAHANLVIHRDLKPANILVTKSGEARLLDFGIAKLMEAEGDALADTELTRHAGRLMTVRYASPEQLTGRPLTTACDVYSLGVVLYELLCGELPYEMKIDSPARLEQSILEVEPRPPSRRALTTAAADVRGSTAPALRKLLGNDLDAITLRALAKQPAQRYASVEALRAELERWLAGEPVEARTPSTAYRVAKFVGRHVVGVALGSAALVALLVVATTAVWLGLQARQESARATAARDFMMGMFKQADSDKSHGADMTARQLLDRGRDDVLRRLQGQPELQADLLQGIVGIQSSMGENTKADVTFDELAKIYLRMGEPRKAALAIAGRADNALRMGDLQMTRAFLDQAAQSAFLGGFQNDSELVVSLSLTKGWLAIYEGDGMGAKRLFEDSGRLADSTYGAHSTQALMALLGLVRSYASLHDFNAAIAAQRQLAERQTQAPDRTPGDMIGLDLNDAELFFQAGQYREVVRRNESARPHCVATLGMDDPNCRRLLMTGARASMRLGKFGDVSRNFAALQAIADDASSPDNQLTTLLLLFRAMSEIGELSRHPDLVMRVRSLAESNKPDSVVPVQRVLILQALAEDALRSGRIDDAQHWLDLAMSLRKASGDLTSNYALTGTTRTLMGVVLLSRGHPADALQILAAAQSDEWRALGKSHPLAMLHSLNQAQALTALGHIGEALQVVDKAQPILLEALGADAPDCLRMLEFREKLHSMLQPPTAATVPGGKSLSRSQLQTVQFFL